MARTYDEGAQRWVSDESSRWGTSENMVASGIPRELAKGYFRGEVSEAQLRAHPSGGIQKIEEYSRLHPSFSSKYGKYVPAAIFALGGGALAGAAFGAAGAGAAGTGGGALANQQALYQMAFDIGLEGAAADAFVASGGTLGSTAAGGGGVGAGAVAGSAPLATTLSPGGSGAPGTGIDAPFPPPAGTNPPTTPAPPGAVGSALSRILNGTATAEDWIQALGTAGATGLGMFSSNQQADSLRDIANQSRQDRAPFLNAATTWMNDPAAYGAGPGKAAADSTLAAAGAKFGNPSGSGLALQLATDAGLRDWRSAVTGMANLGLSGEDTRAQLGVGAAGKDADVWTNLAGGISDIVSPRKPMSLEDMFREWQKYQRA